MYECMNVCMYVVLEYMYVRKYVCMYICMYIRMHVCMFVGLYMYMLEIHNCTCIYILRAMDASTRFHSRMPSRSGKVNIRR